MRTTLRPKALPQPLQPPPLQPGYLDLGHPQNTGCLLLGLPIREDGTIGPSAQHVQEVAAQIQERLPMVTLKFWDERYTTRVATEYLLEANVSRKKRKKSVDKIAAAVILESYMQSEGADRF